VPFCRPTEEGRGRERRRSGEGKNWWWWVALLHQFWGEEASGCQLEDGKRKGVRRLIFMVQESSRWARARHHEADSQWQRLLGLEVEEDEPGGPRLRGP
jgi:hypothetical protein